MKEYVLLGLAVLGWGVWGFFMKLAETKLHPMQMALVTDLFYACTIPAYFWILKGVTSPWNSEGIWFSLICAACATVAGIAYTYSLKHIELTTATGIAAGYPAVTFLLSVIFLSEKVTVMKCVGLAMILLGTVVIGH